MTPYHLALAALVSASLATVGCNSHACTLADCEAGFFTAITVPLKCAELEESTVTVCRNERCSRGKLKCETATYSREKRPEVVLYGPILVDGLFTKGSFTGGNSDDAPGDWILSVRVRAPYGESLMLKDGDRYTVDIVERETDRSLASYEKVVTYERNYPNGKECDGENGYCKVASDVPRRGAP
jgi:hypothetical protein